MLNNIHTLRADQKLQNKELNNSNNTELSSDPDYLSNSEHKVFSILDCFSMGIIIVNSNCEPSLINRYADEVIREKDGLFLERNCLKAASPKMTRELKSAVQLANNGLEKSRCALSIPRPSCLQPLLVLVAPLGVESVVLYITDPERKTLIDPSLIADLFGLTPAESAVAACIVQGERISQIAETLNISIHTVRCHLKHVFSKTGTERQAELANYVGSLLGKLSLGKAKHADDDPMLGRRIVYTASRQAN